MCVCVCVCVCVCFSLPEGGHTLVGGISSRAPSSSNVMLLYSLLAERRLCSIMARSRILEPERKHVTRRFYCSIELLLNESKVHGGASIGGGI